MSRIGTSFTRTSLLQTSSNQLSQLQNTQRDIQILEQQIATGRAVENASDAPERAASILALQSSLRDREQQGLNTATAVSTLNAADGALGEATTILIEARDTAGQHPEQPGVGLWRQQRGRGGRPGV